MLVLEIYIISGHGRGPFGYGKFNETGEELRSFSGY